MSSSDITTVYLFDKDSNSFIPLKADYSNRVPIVTEHGVAAAKALSMKGAKPDKQLGVIVPLTKNRPNASEWVQLATLARKYPRVDTIAIVNPSLDRRGVGVDGPGPDQEYINGIRFLQANGIRVIGYIATGAGIKPFDDVKLEIDKWALWYPTIQGVFFDEMPTLLSSLDYYRRLDQYVKQDKGMQLTVGDMATGHVIGEAVNNDAYFHNTGIDILIVYEHSDYPTESWFSAYKNKQWMQNYPRSKFAWVVSNVSDNDALACINFINKLTGIEKLGGYVYVMPMLGVPDDKRGFSDWNVLSPYLETCLLALDRQANEERIPFYKGVIADTMKIEDVQRDVAGTKTAAPSAEETKIDNTEYERRQVAFDPSGISKIYPTKQDGFVWYLETTRNLEGDRSVKLKPDLKLMPDFSAQIQPSKTQNFLEVWSNEDQKILDCEVTAYVKAQAKGDIIRIHARTGSKAGKQKKNVCNASGYVAVLSADGSVHAEKQIDSEISAGIRAISQATNENLDNRWIGFKFVIHNYRTYDDTTGKPMTAVRLRLFVDTNVQDTNGNLAVKNGWKNIMTTQDAGGWFTKETASKKSKGSEYVDKCPCLNTDSPANAIGRRYDEIISLPGGEEKQNCVIFEFDKSAMTQIRFLSVREISAIAED